MEIVKRVVQIGTALLTIEVNLSAHTHSGPHFMAFIVHAF